jgi:hypothetical protein
VAADFFLNNKLSAKDVSRIVRGAHTSGAEGVADLAKFHLRKNLARDLLSTLLKGTAIPELFQYSIRSWDPDTQEQVMADLPFLLPHELLHSMKDKVSAMKLDHEACPEIAAAFVRKCKMLGLDPMSAVPLGMHGDGVPFTKKDSLELISFNFLAQPHGWRVPFTGISKAYVCHCGCLGKHTWDDILQVLAWSLRALCSGVFPILGPKGEALEGKRKESGGQALALTAVLCQVRGDWPFLKALFSFPAWNSKEGVCWQCAATKTGPLSYRDATSKAPWRNSRVTANQFFSSLQLKQVTPSTLFSSPGFCLEDIVLDWLHIVDLGISQDLIGNLFHECVLSGGLEGANKDERLKVLWQRLQSFYAEAKSKCRLDMLTIEMFERAKQAPKLRAKGGETRHLVPFAAKLSAEVSANSQTTHWATVASVFDLLHTCANVIAERPFNQEKLERCSSRLCILWSSLEREAQAKGSDTNWRMKPKVHMFQELCTSTSVSHGSPELFWTYKDESWCGDMAKASKRRGGQKHVATVPFRLLTRFRALNKD